MNHFIFLLIATAFAHNLDPLDIDMHSQNSKNSNKQSKVLPKESSSECNCSELGEDIGFIYLKRTVNLLLASATQQNDNILKGTFFLEKETSNYKFLEQFAKMETVDIQALRELDKILQQAFATDTSEIILDNLMSTTEKLLNLLNIRTLIMCVGVLAVYIFYYLKKMDYSFFYIIMYFMFLILIVDYAFRYQTLLEEAELHNIDVQSDKCKNMGWLEYIFSKDGTCKKKVVTPLEVALSQVKYMIIVPLSAIGKGTGKLARELWYEVPSPWKFLIFPIMLVFILVLIPTLMTVANGRPFKINIMYLLNIQYGMGESRSDQISGSTLATILNAVNQKPAVQFFPSASSSDTKLLKNKKKKPLRGISWTQLSSQYNKEKMEGNSGA